MKTHRFALLALALVLVLAGAAQAETTYIPIARQEEPRGVEVHVQMTWCVPGLSLDVAGHAISVWDGDTLLGSGVTDEQGLALFTVRARPGSVVEVGFEGSHFVEEQAITVVSQEGPLYVGIWAKSRWFVQCSGMATNWPLAGR